MAAMMPSIRKCIIALGVAGFSFSAAPIYADPVSVDAKTVVTAPNWVLGSNWYYSDGYALKVNSAAPGNTVFDRIDAPGQWFSRQGFLRKDLTSGTATRTSIFRTISDQAGMSLRAGSPLTFQREYLENGTLMVHASSWSVEGRETITVPAGTFDCWLIVWRSRSLRSDWTGFERWWYSPQAQNYVRMEYKYGPDAEGSRVLMRYQIGAQAADNKSAENRPTENKVDTQAAAQAPAKTEVAIQAPMPPAPEYIAPVQPAADADARVPVVLPPAPPAQQPVAAGNGNPAPTPSAAKTKHADAADPASTRGTGRWHVLVASSRKEAAIRKSLDKTLRGHATLLKDVPSGIVAVQVGGRGLFYGAWLGEFDRSAQAVAFCGTLRVGGMACSVSRSGRAQDTRLSKL
jgi:hypothetical protein